jgi:hypothetical protein
MTAIPVRTLSDSLQTLGNSGFGKMPTTSVRLRISLSSRSWVILSFRVRLGRDLRHRVADSVVDAMTAASSRCFRGLDRYRIGSGIGAGRRVRGRAGGGAGRFSSGELPVALQGGGEPDAQGFAGCALAVGDGAGLAVCGLPRSLRTWSLMSGWV